MVRLPTILQKMKLPRFLFVSTIIIAVILATVLIYFRVAVTSPEAAGDTKFTFIVFGIDNDGGNADTILVATFDSVNYTLNTVSIPRDTILNIGSDIHRRAGLILPSMVERYQNRHDALTVTIGIFTDILGFEPDFHFVVDMEAFVALVDAIGGVEFYIPVDMNYADPYQDLFIRHTRGLHYLTGQQAIEVVRYRLTYEDGDIGRVRTQQNFLASAAQQILNNPPNITEIAGIFLNYVETDLRLGELIWLAGEFLKMDTENIHFATMPGSLHSADGMQYVMISTVEWLEIINERLNPSHVEITVQKLNIVQ